MTLGLPGMLAIAVTRPPPAAGPRLRKRKPRWVPGGSSPAAWGDSGGSPSFFAAAGVGDGVGAFAGVAPNTAAEARAATSGTRARAIFIEVSFSRKRRELFRDPATATSATVADLPDPWPEDVERPRRAY